MYVRELKLQSYFSLNALVALNDICSERPIE